MNPKTLVTASCFLTPLMIVFTACSSASKEWNDAQRQDTPQAYSTFLEDHGDSEYAEEATQRIREYENMQNPLASDMTSKNLYAQSTEENIASLKNSNPEDMKKWEDVQANNTLEAYQDFIAKHPDSEFREQALTKFSDLGSDQLRAASAGGDLNAVKAILEKGIPVDGATDNGTTPLMWAAMNGHSEVADYLIGQGAEVNQQTKEGVSALMLSAEKGHVETVSHLLKKQASPLLQAITGDTAMDLASRNRQREILQILLNDAIQSGQDQNSTDPKELPSTKMLVQGIEQVTRETLKDLTTDKDLDVNIVGISRFDQTAGHHLLYGRVAILEENQRKDLGFIRHFRLRPMEESNWKLEMITTQTGGIATESAQTQ